MRKLKICVIGTRGFPDIQGGVEKHCEEVYSRLAKYGLDIKVFVRSPYYKRTGILKFYKGIHLLHLWCPHNKYFEAITHTILGIALTHLIQPDILHIHAIGPALLTPLAKLSGLKVVVTTHGPDYMRNKWGPIAKSILKIGEFSGINFADKVIVISKFLKKVLHEKYTRSDLYFIPNGVKLPQILPPGNTLKKFDLSPRNYIFTACRFVPEKGLHELIKAFNKIKAPKLKLVIAGDAHHETKYSRKLKNLARESSNIILPGFISGITLKELFSNAGLFVLPSFYEGSPIALLEALSYELPVLVSDIPQNREIPLEDFRFFTPGNVNMLSKKIIELFKIGISSEEKIKLKNILQKEYNWDKAADKIFKVYKTLV